MLCSHFIIFNISGKRGFDDLPLSKLKGEIKFEVFVGNTELLFYEMLLLDMSNRYIAFDLCLYSQCDRSEKLS